MESLISVFTVYCIHISLHLQMFFFFSFFFFLFPVFRILTGTCTELFFLMELYFKKGKYFCLSTPRNIHRLATAKQIIQ